MKKFLLSIFCCLMAFVSVQAEEVSGTITFKTSSPDSSSTATASNFVSNQVTGGGGFTLSCTATNNCYTGVSGLKMSSSSKNGSFTLGLGDTYNVKKVIVNAVKYKSDAAKLTVNDSTAETLTTSLEDYTFAVNADISQIKVDMTKRGYIASITIVYEVAAEGEATAPKTPIFVKDDADFVGSMMVAVSCETEGAEIYYTTDGSEPTEDSDQYIEPFEITETTTVKAIAFNEVGPSYVATATYTRVAATPVISFEGDASAIDGKVVVSIKTENNAVAYYTLNGVTPDASSTIYEEPITIKANATLKVFAIEAGKYESEISTQEFVMAVAGSDEAEESVTLSFASKDQRTEYTTSVQVWEQNGITLTNNKGKSTSNVADYAAPARFYKSSEIIVEFTSPIAKIEFTCNTTGYATDLKSSISAGASVSGKVVTVLLDGTSNSFTIESLSAQVRMDALTVTPVAEASVEDYVLNVTEAGWATLYLGYDVVIPDGVKCYVISEIGTEAVQLEEVTADVLPAGTGVIVEAEEGEYTFEVSKTADEIESIMLGTTKNEYIDEEAYVLAIVDGEVGLYKAEMNGGVWLNNAYKAYLPASEVPSNVSFYGFRFGEGTTGVAAIEIRNENEVIFDLAGRRVSEITAPGIYIINGKKVIK